MNIITVENIEKAYGETKIFDSASFFLQEGEKAGIVGVNGTGKTTLLKIIAGLERPDEGKIILANNLTMKYLPQEPEFEDGDTILSAVTKDNKTSENEWTIESDAKNMLTKLGIYDYEKPCRYLSGGQRKRIAIVSLLLSNADVILLDEPTNHLDNAMSAWLEEQLKGYRGSVIMVTHDRYFLDSVATRIIEIDRGKIYSYRDNYSGFIEHKMQRQEIADATKRKRQSLLRVELEWVKRGARARSTKQKARLERYEELKNTPEIQKDEKIELGSLSKRLGKTTIELQNITKSYDGKIIINDFSYNFLKDDRIGIIGKNGCGKSTLLKIINGLVKPDSGKVTVGQTVSIGYFAQDILLSRDMDPNERVIDYIRDVAEYVNTRDGQISAARLLEKFLFKGENQYGLIGKLSGGERKRLHLCRILMESPNILILDEPTNDLDITTLMVLEDYLDTFCGIVIAVSHDRYFLDRVTRRIFAFGDNGIIRCSEGGYTDYENRYGTFDVEIPKAKKESEKKVVNQKQSNRRLKFSYNEQREFATIEEDIAELEDKLKELDRLIEDNARDFVKLGELDEERQEIKEKLSEKMDRWMYLTELSEQIEAQKNT